MRKRFLSLMLTLTLLAGICVIIPLNVNAETYTPAETFYLNGHTYLLYNERMTWKEAKEYCESIGGHLVTIESQEEKEKIYPYIDDYEDVWIGAKILYYGDIEGYINGTAVSRDSIMCWITTGDKIDESIIENVVGEPSMAATYLTIDKYDNDLYLDNCFEYNLSDSFICEIEPQNKQNNIKVYLNNNRIEFDQPPVMINDRTMVPVRAIFEALGATVGWNEEEQLVLATKDSTTVVIRIGEYSILKNGVEIPFDVAPQVINGRTLVPVRVVAEAFGTRVDWDEDTQTVLISR